MFGWPVVERELRQAARNRWHHSRRALAAGAAMLVALALLALGGGTLLPADLGEGLFLALAVIALLLALFAGPLLTADALSEERRLGMLGQLFLSRLGATDIVFGKLAAHG